MSFVLLKTLTSILLSWGICFYNDTLSFQHYQFLFINWLILTGIRTYLNITHLKNKNNWLKFFWLLPDFSVTLHKQESSKLSPILIISLFYHLLFFFNQHQPGVSLSPLRWPYCGHQWPILTPPRENSWGVCCCCCCRYLFCFVLILKAPEFPLCLHFLGPVYLKCSLFCEQLRRSLN